MKNYKVFLTLILFSFIFHLGYSQDNCLNAEPICSDESYSFPNATNTGVISGPNYGCLADPALDGMQNPQWYYMQIGESGVLEFEMSQTGNSGQGLDLDFVLWGPFDSFDNGCQQVMNGVAPIQCSNAPFDTETIGIGTQGGSNYWLENGGLPPFFPNPGTIPGLTTPPPAQAGDFYIIVITNADNQPGTINLQQTNNGEPGAGETDCGIVEPCHITNLTANIGACDPATNTFSITGSLEFDEAPTTGELIIEDCNGNSVSFPVASITSPLNYTINDITSNGGDCTITAHFSDAPNCTATTQEYQNPAPCVPTCFFTYLEVTIGPCNAGNNNNFEITGSVEFIDPPSTGQLIVEDCDGNQQTFNAPFTSPTNFTISDIYSDGEPCQLTAYFTEDTDCFIESDPYDNPSECGGCSAYVGTFTSSVEGEGENDFVLCFGDEIHVEANGNWHPAEDIGEDTNPVNPISYDPGLGYLVYTCPPTVLPPGDLNSDPCLVGVVAVSDIGFFDVNDEGFFSIGNDEYHTIYFVPITFYDKDNFTYSFVDETNEPCFDLGAPIEVTYLPEITFSNLTENCNSGSVTVQINGGWPEIDNTKSFTASNLTPTTASFVTNTASNGGQIEITGLQAGDTYSFTVKDDNGCPITVTGGPFIGGPNISISSVDPTCSNVCDGTATVTVISGIAPYSYAWSQGGNPISGDVNTISNLCEGNYSVSVTDASECSATLEVTLNEPGLIDASFALSDFCQGNTNGATNIAVLGGTFSFTTPPGNGTTINPTTGEITGGVAGATYTVEYALDLNGCTNSSEEQVTVFAIPSPSFLADSLYGCKPLTVSFSPTYQGTNAQCIWNFGDGTSINSCGSTISHTYNQSGVFSVTLEVTSDNGCVGGYGVENYIQVIPAPKANFSYSPETISSFNKVVQFDNQSLNSTDYLWSFGDGTSSSETSPSHDYSGTEEDTYVVTLVASINGECPDTLNIAIPSLEDLIYYIPNTFTPDNDNFNEEFKPIFTSGFDPLNYHLAIFNRWGETLFESFNVDYGWRGTYGSSGNSGLIVPDGTYVWKIRFKRNKKDEFIEIMGHINVLR